MKKIYMCFILSFTLFFVHFVQAQTGTIKGVVTDSKSKETLIGVNIILQDKSGTTTDFNGKYELKISPGLHTVEYKFIGYKTITRSIQIAEGETKVIDVQMQEATQHLDIVVVSAGKFEQKLGDVTVSMEVIKPSLVENKNTVNMESIVEQTPGVNIVDGQANIRGGGGFSYGAGSRVLLLVDDLPMLTADAGDVKWSFLPVENLEQIEVIKGASSALFGSSALNGVINFRTAYPKDTPQTKINIFHGLYGDPVRRDSLGNLRDSLGNLNKPLKWWDNANPVYTGANFFHSRKIGNLDLVVGGNIFSDEGYRELEKEQRGRLNFNTRYRFKNIEGLSAGVNANAMWTQGGLFLIWQDADSGAYRPMGGEVSNYVTIRANVDPYVTYFNKKGDRLSLRTRYFTTRNINDTQQESFADLYYSEFQYQKQYSETFTTTYGAVAIYSDVTSDLYENHNANNLAAFAQIDKKWGKFSFSAGVRAEYFRTDTIESIQDLSIYPMQGVFRDTINVVRNTPVKPVFRLGTNYHAAEATYIRASYGMGYRFPSIAERFIRTNAGGLQIYPNPDLRPETGWSAEIGVKQGMKLGSWKGFFDVAGFMTRYRNMMEFSFGPWGPDTLSFGIGIKALNVGEAMIKGIDLSWMGTGKIIGDLELTLLAGYTYINPMIGNLRDTIFDDVLYISTLSDTSSNMLKYRFRHLVKADVQLDYKKFSTGLSFRYNSFMVNVDRFFEDPFFGPLLSPGVADYRRRNNQGDYIFDYRIAYQMQETSKIALIINNVLNREYMIRPADIQAPRTVAIQYTLAF
jgi:outer membrane cobalamin receptor